MGLKNGGGTYFSSVERKLLIVFDDLPFMNERRLVVTKINLILRAIRGVDNRLDGGVYNLSGVHVDADFVADFGLFIGHGQTITVTALRFRLAPVDYRQILGANLQQGFKLGDFKTLVLGVQDAEQYYMSSM